MSSIFFEKQIETLEAKKPMSREMAMYLVIEALMVNSDDDPDLQDIVRGDGDLLASTLWDAMRPEERAVLKESPRRKSHTSAYDNAKDLSIKILELVENSL